MKMRVASIKIDAPSHICYARAILLPLKMMNIIQIILSVPLVIAILLQSKGSGLSGIFGGEGNVFRTKRGAEKTLFIFTIVNAVLFFSIALLNVFLQ